MLVQRGVYEKAVAEAKAVAESVTVGPANEEGRHIGPVVNEVQWNKIQDLIQAGIDEGATLVAGGTGRPDGLDEGYYIRPTLFANVTNDMRIAREEIFGPVLVIIGYDDDDDAVRIANDTPYGLSGYVSGSPERAVAIARRIRTGNMHVNGAGPDFQAPFGGYKQSGNGREWGSLGLEEFLETKAIMGAPAS
jgi:aldehyde dehydrogenase (NAD+)